MSLLAATERWGSLSYETDASIDTSADGLDGRMRPVGWSCATGASADGYAVRSELGYSARLLRSIGVSAGHVQVRNRKISMHRMGVCCLVRTLVSE